MLPERHKEFLYFLGYFYLQHRKLSKALTLFAALKATGVDTWFLHMAIGQAKLMQGEAQDALEEARQAHRLCEDRDQERQTLFLMARALWQMGEREEARQYFRKFVETGRQT